jgi:hypothetical protein
VNFAQIHNIQLRGHTLLWHRTIPSWMLEGSTSQPLNYRATIQQNLRNYIFAVVQHFPNVYAWDVVNEVASDTQNSANPYRTNSAWYQAYSVGGLNGSDYVRDVPLPTRLLVDRRTCQHEAHAERLQHQLQQTRQCHPDRASWSTAVTPSTASGTSSTCSSTRT